MKRPIRTEGSTGRRERTLLRLCTSNIKGDSDKICDFQ